MPTNRGSEATRGELGAPITTWWEGKLEGDHRRPRAFGRTRPRRRSPPAWKSTADAELEHEHAGELGRAGDCRRRGG
jgi:hypothetical protein